MIEDRDCGGIKLGVRVRVRVFFFKGGCYGMTVSLSADQRVWRVQQRAVGLAAWRGGLWVDLRALLDATRAS